MRHPWLRSTLLSVSLLPVAACALAQTESLAAPLSSGPLQTQGALQGSVPASDVPSGPLVLSLDEALKRGLRYNLGSIESQQVVRQAHGERTVARSPLMPNLNGDLREVAEQIDLASFGF